MNSLVILVCILSLVAIHAYLPSSPLKLQQTCVKARHSAILKPLSMNLFDSIFGPKKTASAAHILVKGADGKDFLLKLKADLNKAKNVKEQFGLAAKEYSQCPSAKNFGELGTFKQGQMVAQFDAIVFKEPLNTIHGPVTTLFGNHLIYINDRSE